MMLCRVACGLSAAVGSERQYSKSRSYDDPVARLRRERNAIEHSYWRSVERCPTRQKRENLATASCCKCHMGLLPTGEGLAGVVDSRGGVGFAAQGHRELLSGITGSGGVLRTSPKKA